MPTAWFICPYKRKDFGSPEANRARPTRYCAMDDFTREIRASGGDWSETEIEGDQAIVKVRATNQILGRLSSEFRRFPDRAAAVLEWTPTRKTPRYVPDLDEILIDGVDVPSKRMDTVDREVSD